MNRDDSNSTDDGIPAISPERIFDDWQRGKSARQIAHERNLDITIVMRILKQKQKSVLKRGS